MSQTQSLRASSSDVLLYEMTWPQVEKYLCEKKTILVPVGSTEQHGPTGPIGIDFLTAWEISREVGMRTHTLVSSPLSFGMALHHMDFPGTISLKPSTYVRVIQEIAQSLIQHGFKKIIFVNGHGGNIASITTAFSEIKDSNDTTDLSLINWWHLPEVVSYESQHFGDQNGFHATVGEISCTMHIHPQANYGDGSFVYEPTAERPHWPMAPVEFREVFKDGRMGSNPNLATAEHGAKIFEIAVQSICKKLHK